MSKLSDLLQENGKERLIEAGILRPLTEEAYDRLVLDAKRILGQYPVVNQSPFEDGRNIEMRLAPQGFVWGKPHKYAKYIKVDSDNLDEWALYILSLQYPVYRVWNGQGYDLIDETGVENAK